ncbi:MAG TPA: nucleotidyltransferase substrate binding protein [Syntrophomonadaceae bacterium]|nr:nucleotidyltransferase substrate binding protein [Syntrophomonadaceae bacterium]
MTAERIREKLSSYSRALERLERIVQEPEVNDYRLDALIQRFEFSYELAWKLIKAWLEFKGIEVSTPRDCFREAFAVGLTKEGEGWLQMLNDRNLSAHTYNETDARRIGERIEKKHYPLLAELLKLIEDDVK